LSRVTSRAKNVCTRIGFGVGMRQCDLASATVLASRDGDGEGSEASIEYRRLHAPVAAREIAALAALLPEFAIDRRRPATAADCSAGVATCADARHQHQMQGRAAALGVPFVRLGPGVLRAPPRWRGGATPVLSATAHKMTGPSSPADFLHPERLLETRGWESPALLVRAAGARRDMVARRLGGAWWNSPADPGLPPGDGLALIIIGDGNKLAAKGSPSPALARAMLAVALAENPPNRIVLLAPASEGRLGFFDRLRRDAVSRGCTVLTRPLDPWQAIERADRVYAAGGETGFLALLAGARIRCFADSFYSGWGITTDDPRVLQKPFRRTIDEVFAGACLVATRYREPFRNRGASFEDILEIVAEWRNIDDANRRIAVCLGMSFWKRRQVTAFLRSSAGAPAFRRTTSAALKIAHARSESAVAVWASRAPAGLAEAAGCRGVPVIRVEDGFIRSVGLGSDFMPAASLVLDSRGMHFDPRVCSDLEVLLLETEFTPALVERARALIAQLVARRVTKYNLGKRDLSLEWSASEWPAGEWPAGKRRILVPGQVEDDLSVQLGGEGVGGNLDLLARVRAANPDALILYKPHPDVEAGHRNGQIPDEAACKFADTIIRDISTAAVLDEIDELHTLTSLAGFEALLRRRQVVVYGRPFYAGWGLTTDLAGTGRGRRLALEELVAGALILYPRYLDPVTRLPCGPEIVIERLDNPELWRPGLLVAARRFQGLLARRWNKLARKTGKHPAGPFPPPGRDEFRTPLL
jgi:capsular polysaccharide export protein